MEWTDQGIVLSARKHGEGGAVVTLMTANHGRHAGLIKGASSPKNRGVLQPGNKVRATWKARLAEHLGSYAIELSDSHVGDALGDALKLAALSSACAITEATLPEREPHPNVYLGFEALLSTFGMEDIGDAWVAAYVRWELGVLADIGYGLDLETCVVTGQTDQLEYVSPKSGRAVSTEAAEPYKDKLLALPRFLIGMSVDAGAGTPEDLAKGLELTGFFLERHVFGAHGKLPPPARTRFVERFERMHTISGGGTTDDHDISCI